ncbi:TPA: hypothetical protein MO340_000248 [Salmonella enterica subsp. salamae serovar 35:g,m,s,t:-]|nr:hypothetical protein [Salmonella enterica subsp. salamae serovar 35:g,m,s,t:-]HCA3418867.1 hypothetical protein [Salmonella enterica subsp. salamae serovar 35:g,m,s,t:-]HCA3428034.1 hypothetical protein [Salmonella enterica subsp. salamae serovar 35:g,m,s,t:-]HCA3437671.1 hypothetical protein [Salmonella enterica subsp. salamae serovar 35:g,m,s,t:-]HCA3442177.1 hypothetical protein [Salmonella enterica subsp. salamae serovar 35:g,m,s,t:-]
MSHITIQNENRLRVLDLLKKIKTSDSPTGWKKHVEIAVGGLTEVGFSKTTNDLLVISSSGRGLIDCTTGEKIARDYEEYGDWYDPVNLICQGIGRVEEEIIHISGLCGGGLPFVNRYGESLERVAPEWPVEDIIFCPPGKTALIPSFQEGCVRFISDYIRAVGFSWCGEFLVCATSSDVTIWKRDVRRV